MGDTAFAIYIVLPAEMASVYWCVTRMQLSNLLMRNCAVQTSWTKCSSARKVYFNDFLRNKSVITQI